MLKCEGGVGNVEWCPWAHTIPRWIAMAALRTTHHKKYNMSHQSLVTVAFQYPLPCTVRVSERKRENWPKSYFGVGRESFPSFPTALPELAYENKKRCHHSEWCDPIVYCLPRVHLFCPAVRPLDLVFQRRRSAWETWEISRVSQRVFPSSHTTSMGGTLILSGGILLFIFCPGCFLFV